MALLSGLWGDDIAIAWRCLCYRPYVVPPSMRVVPLVSEVVFTDAARGAVNVGYLYDMPSSPSPASSLLCLTKAQRKWFPDYALLGDDLVIGNIRVAKQYRKLVRRLGFPLFSFFLCLPIKTFLKQHFSFVEPKRNLIKSIN